MPVPLAAVLVVVLPMPVVVATVIVSFVVAVWLLMAGRRRRWYRRAGPVERRLRVHQVLQLAAVEEDSPTFAALVNADAVALVLAHGPLAFRTC